MKLSFLVLLIIAAVGVAQRWQVDKLRCGSGFRAPDGNMAECDPDHINPCCSWVGWCGSTEQHCACSKCVDYRVRPLTCGDLQAAGKTTSAYYPLYPSSSCLEPIWVFCDMTKDPGKEIMDLPPENDNFAKSGYNETLRDIIGVTNFSKIALEFSPCGVHVDVYNTHYVTTTGRSSVAYGHASDCFPRPEWVNGSYRPVDDFDGEFKVDLSGTQTQLRDDVYWGIWGKPDGLGITNFSMRANRTVVTAKCGGYCGGCAPAFMWLEPSTCTPKEISHQIVFQPPDDQTALCLQLNLTFAPCDPKENTQRWRWDGGRLLRNLHDDSCLEVNNSNNNNALRMNPQCNAASSLQRFERSHVIVKNINTSLCLDVDDIDNPSAPVLRECASSSSLLWPFENRGQDFYSNRKALPAPLALKVNWTMEQAVKLIWKSPKFTCDALYGYIIRVNKSEDGTPGYYHSSTLWKRIEGLEVGKAYKATAFAVWSGGISHESSTLEFGTRPSRPENFNISDVTEHTVSLNWTASTGDVVTYRVNCVPSDGEGKRYWKRVPSDAFNHTCAGLDSGVMYNVTVAAETALRRGRTTGAYTVTDDACHRRCFPRHRT